MIPTLDGNEIEAELARLRETQLNREQVDEIVAGLGKIIGVDDLALDESGVAELVVDEDIELSLIHLPHFPGIVAAIPMPEGAENDGQLLRKLLQANMSWAMTQGGSFAFVPPRVALGRLIPLTQTDSERLDRELAAFVELATAWRNEITEYLNAGEDDPSTQELPEEDVARLRV